MCNPLLQVTDVKQNKGGKPGGTTSAKKAPIVDPLSFSDPLSGGVSTTFEGSDPLSMLSAAAPTTSTITNRSSRSSSLKVKLLNLLFVLSFHTSGYSSVSL